MSAVKANGALPSTPPGGGLWLRLRRWVGTVAWGAYRGDNPGILIGAMLILIAIFAYLLRDTGFMSPINLLSIVRVSTTITIMAVAIVFVLCAGEIDLSIAAIVPVSALITAVLLSWDYNFALAGLIGALFGAGVGLMNGLAVVFFKIPSFVVTLGSMGIMQGTCRNRHQRQHRFDCGTNLSFFGSAGLVWPDTGPRVLVPRRLDHRISDPLEDRHGPTRSDRGERARSTLLRDPDRTGQDRRAHRQRRCRRPCWGSLRRSICGRQFYHWLQLIFCRSSPQRSLVGRHSRAARGTVSARSSPSLLVGTLNNALVLVGFGAPQQVMVQGVIIVAAVVVSSRPAGAPVGDGLSRSRKPSTSATPTNEFGPA